VGENHVAVLLENGRICRIAYSEELPTLFPSSATPAPPTAKEKRCEVDTLCHSLSYNSIDTVMTMERLHPVPDL
jgi:hypothetical protein